MNEPTLRWMEITTVISCQNFCSYCPQQNLIDRYRETGARAGQSMRLLTFEICLSKIPRDWQIHFSGYAEPFQNDCALDMIELAAADGREIQLYTTLRFVTHDMLDRLKAIKFHTVVIHLPDADMKFRPGQEYYDVLKRVASGEVFNTDKFQMMSPAGGPKKLFAEIYKVVPKEDIIFSNQVSRAGNLGKWVEKGGDLYCVRSPELKQNVLLPDGRVQVCCNDYSLQHSLGNLLNGEWADLTPVDPTPLCINCESAKPRPAV